MTDVDLHLSEILRALLHVGFFLLLSFPPQRMIL